MHDRKHKPEEGRTAWRYDHRAEDHPVLFAAELKTAIAGSVTIWSYARASVETSERVVLTCEFAFDVAELQEVIALRLKFGVINIGASGEVGAAVSGLVRHGSKCSGGLLPLDAHTISAIKRPSDDPGHQQL